MNQNVEQSKLIQKASTMLERRNVTTSPKKE
jgi:hypothetical protein